MKLDDQGVERLEELRLEAFSKLSTMVDEFVHSHWGDKPQLVQFAMFLEFIEATSNYCVVNKIPIETLININSSCFNKYMNELVKEKGET